MNAKVTGEQAQNLKTQLDQQGVPLSTEYDKKGSLVVTNTDTSTRKKVREVLKTITKPQEIKQVKEPKQKKLKQKVFDL